MNAKNDLSVLSKSQKGSRTNAAIAGKRLRDIREDLGLSLREVETASRAIATRIKNNGLVLSPGRLSEIETRGCTPSIYKLYALCVIYNICLKEVVGWYGIDL